MILIDLCLRMRVETFCKRSLFSTRIIGCFTLLSTISRLYHGNIIITSTTGSYGHQVQPVVMLTLSVNMQYVVSKGDINQNKFARRKFLISNRNIS